MIDEKNSLTVVSNSKIEELHPIKSSADMSQNAYVCSEKKGWFKCRNCGYEWKKSFKHLSKGEGCPKCVKKDENVAETVDLATINPELAKEWHTTKNEAFTSKDVSINSMKKVWWKCRNCGYEWKATVDNRSKGSGCPSCSSSKESHGIIRAIASSNSQLGTDETLLNN